MISFFNEPCLKAAVIERVKEHQRLDQIIQGTYWDGARGCAIGCVLHSSDHMSYETQLGLPVFLAYMDEHIFERLPLKDAKMWPLRFIEAVPVGVDLELVFPRFMHWLLSDPDGMRKHANLQTMPIIDSLMAMYARRIDGIPFDRKAAEAAEAAARAAARAAGAAARAVARAARAAGAAAVAAARAAEAAVEAAEAAAWAAGAAAGAAAVAAEAAVEAAEAAVEAAEAAGAAAWAAAWAAGAAARAVARAARAAEAAEAAGAVYIHRQADYLILLLQSYESMPVLVSTPCEEREWIDVTR